MSISNSTHSEHTGPFQNPPRLTKAQILTSAGAFSDAHRHLAKLEFRTGRPNRRRDLVHCGGRAGPGRARLFGPLLAERFHPRAPSQNCGRSPPHATRSPSPAGHREPDSLLGRRPSARTGAWPTSASGIVPEAPAENWHRLNYALRRGTRSLSGGSSVAQLLDRHRGKRKRGRPNRFVGVTTTQILAWVDAYRAQGGVAYHSLGGAT